MTGGGSRNCRGGSRRESESSRGFNCDLLSLATVRSHNRGNARFKADNKAKEKEERSTCLSDKEGGR